MAQQRWWLVVAAGTLISCGANNDDLAPSVIVTSQQSCAALQGKTLAGANIVSNFGFLGQDNFTSEDTGNAPPNNGQPIGQIGLVTVPSDVIPEPSILGLGALGAMALLRRRK